MRAQTGTAQLKLVQTHSRMTKSVLSSTRVFTLFIHESFILLSHASSGRDISHTTSHVLFCCQQQLDLNTSIGARPLLFLRLDKVLAAVKFQHLIAPACPPRTHRACKKLHFFHCGGGGGGGGMESSFNQSMH
jgi:hypothetical protein